MSRFRAEKVQGNRIFNLACVPLCVCVCVCRPYVSVFAWLFGYEILTDLTIDNAGHVESRGTDKKQDKKMKKSWGRKKRRKDNIQLGAFHTRKSNVGPLCRFFSILSDVSCFSFFLSSSSCHCILSVSAC